MQLGTMNYVFCILNIIFALRLQSYFVRLYFDITNYIIVSGCRITMFSFKLVIRNL
jgi:hypothetical protein